MAKLDLSQFDVFEVKCDESGRAFATDGHGNVYDEVHSAIGMEAIPEYKAPDMSSLSFEDCNASGAIGDSFGKSVAEDTGFQQAAAYEATKLTGMHLL